MKQKLISIAAIFMVLLSLLALPVTANSGAVTYYKFTPQVSETVTYSVTSNTAFGNIDSTTGKFTPKGCPTAKTVQITATVTGGAAGTYSRSFVVAAFYGARGYENPSSPSKNDYNCQGYAFGTYDWPGKTTIGVTYQPWFNYTFDQRDSWTNVNTALTNTKSQLESNWLNVYFSGRWQDVTNSGGVNAELEYNQYLVAMRVGIGDIYSIDLNGDGLPDTSIPSSYQPLVDAGIINKTTYDYHFWYRTSNGQWANKHGRDGDNDLLSTTDQPTTNGSSGWVLVDGLGQYYNSDIVYYRITRS